MINLSSIPPRITRAEASAYLLTKYGLSRSPGTLAKLAVIGGGPAFRKAGLRRVIYDVSELDRWADGIISQPMTSTSQAA